jgi:hypothetical protein
MPLLYEIKLTSRSSGIAYPYIRNIVISLHLPLVTQAQIRTPVNRKTRTVFRHSDVKSTTHPSVTALLSSRRAHRKFVLCMFLQWQGLIGSASSPLDHTNVLLQVVWKSFQCAVRAFLCPVQKLATPQACSLVARAEREVVVYQRVPQWQSSSLSGHAYEHA